MARIRTIKPEFPQSETIGGLSRDARLLFVQLWTVVDDDGRTRAASRLLASLLYPYDEDARGLIDVWLRELDAAGCIHRYEVDGTRYLAVCKWAEHQKIDRPSASKLPEPPEYSANAREASRGLDAVSSILDLGSGTVDQTDLGTAPPPKPRRSAPALAPGCAILKAETGRTPPAAIRTEIEAAYASHGADKLKATAHEWVRRGFKPTNFGGILDVMTNGWRQNGNGHHGPLIQPDTDRTPDVIRTPEERAAFIAETKAMYPNVFGGDA